MSLESKLSKTAKFVATGAVGIAALTAAGYGLGEILQGTYIDGGIQHIFNAFDVKYNDLGTLGSFVGFGTGLKMTALLEFYNAHQGIKKAYGKTKNFIKNLTKKEDTQNLETKVEKPKSYSKLKTLGTYLICGAVGMGLGKIVGECFENVSYTNQAITYLFNTFADVHFKELGDLITLLGMIWGFRFKPQLELLYFYWTDKEKYRLKKEGKYSS